MAIIGYNWEYTLFSDKPICWNLLKLIIVGIFFQEKSQEMGLAHAAGGCSARMQTRTRSQWASAKYCNVTAQNACGANLLQKLRCNSALLYTLRKFWECTCICWQLLRSWLQKPLAFACYKNEKNTSVPTWWVLRLLTSTSPWQVLKSPFIYCFQATGKALRPTAPRWKSLSGATPEPAHIVRGTGKFILNVCVCVYIYIHIYIYVLQTFQSRSQTTNWSVRQQIIALYKSQCRCLKR